MNFKTVSIALFGLLAGCGISDGKLLVDLEAADWDKLAAEVECHEYDCEGFAYTIGTCETDDTDAGEADNTVDLADDCTATVGDLRACNDAFIAQYDADACSTEWPAECDWMLDCSPAVE